jgi:hypothetical protein
MNFKRIPFYIINFKGTGAGTLGPHVIFSRLDSEMEDFGFPSK